MRYALLRRGRVQGKIYKIYCLFLVLATNILYASYRPATNAQPVLPVDENRIQQCCAAPHEHCFQQHVTVLLSITRCNNIIDNNVCGVQHNIVESCFHKPGTTWAFYACI